MTEQNSRTSRLGWRRLLAATAATGVWTACLTGLAPSVAVADDIQSQQWYLDQMKAEEMWKVSQGEGVKVAVVDSGVDSSIPTLRGQVLPGKDLSGGPRDEMKDRDGHGTSMAQLIAGTGADGSVKGIAPKAKILSFKTGGDPAGRAGNGAVLFMGETIRAAAESDAQIINVSLAGGPDQVTRKAIDYAVSKGKLVFAGTGNEGKGGNFRQYPAALPEVAGIAAMGKSGKVADFSTHGRDTTLAGPGLDVPAWCDGKKKKYCVKGNGGTSAATAITSGAAALLWAKHPDWTANQVLRVLIKTASGTNKGKGRSKYLGYGGVRPRINLLEGKGDPGDPDISPLTGEKTINSRAGQKSSPGKGSDKDDAPDKVKVADSSSDDGSSNVLWISLGAVALVIVLSGGAFAWARARRE
ncbi:S8 family serine peptidase [Streptomyces sp. NPDC048172]|uniref:S8 family serine peptidase n=1 Tax=Streptomyces sp. NPDC048172 TaxID=3365505 RepID=UPI003719C9CF